MGLTTTVGPGSLLTTAIAATATAITVTNVGAAALDWAQGDAVKLTGAENIDCAGAAVNVVNALLDAAPADGVITGNTISGFDAPGSTTAMLAGAVVANTTKPALVENSDYVIDYTGGRLRWINVALVAGRTLAVCYQYQRADNTKIRLGKFLPTIEAKAELIHKFPDGRVMTVVLHRASITPDTVSLGFDDADWIGTDLILEALASNDPQHVNEPFGYITIEHKSDGTNSVGYDPDSYSVGLFDLFITMNDATAAAARGLTTDRIDVGNISVGALDANNTFLKHYRGTPKVTDKVVLTQKELSITATIENLNTVNLALLFDGEMVADNLGAAQQDAAALLTIPSDLGTAAGIATWYSIGAMNVNPA